MSTPPVNNLGPNDVSTFFDQQNTTQPAGSNSANPASAPPAVADLAEGGIDMSNTDFCLNPNQAMTHLSLTTQQLAIAHRLLADPAQNEILVTLLRKQIPVLEAQQHLLRELLSDP